MQESSCNSDTIGGAGEQGLMQITRDKCTGAPNGNCRDPVSLFLQNLFKIIFDSDIEISQDFKYFKGTLDSNSGDVLWSVGTYNGFRV